MAKKAIGVHAFAGGMTVGVQQAGLKVVEQLEVHGLGDRTVRERLGVGTAIDPNGEWGSGRKHKFFLAFGNPRCSGFSQMSTDPRMKNAYGANAKQTVDIKQCVAWARREKPRFFVVESVQAAMTTGYQTMRELAVELKKAGYSVAHLKYPNACFGVPQVRNRYLMVASRKNEAFGARLPQDAIVKGQTMRTVRDCIADLKTLPAYSHPINRKDPGEYDDQAFLGLSDNQWAIVPMLRPGWSTNHVAHRLGVDAIRQAGAECWADSIVRRCGDPPHKDLCFGHDTNNVFRLGVNAPAPVMHNGCGHLINPWKDRPITVREMCRLMCWPDDVTPAGGQVPSQLGRGVCPPIGRWIAGECLASHDGKRRHHVFPDAEVEVLDSKERIVSWNHLAPDKPANVADSKHGLVEDDWDSPKRRRARSKGVTR